MYHRGISHGHQSPVVVNGFALIDCSYVCMCMCMCMCMTGVLYRVYHKVYLMVYHKAVYHREDINHLLLWMGLNWSIALMCVYVCVCVWQEYYIECITGWILWCIIGYISQESTCCCEWVCTDRLLLWKSKTFRCQGKSSACVIILITASGDTTSSS